MRRTPPDACRRRPPFVRGGRFRRTGPVLVPPYEGGAGAQRDRSDAMSTPSRVESIFFAALSKKTTAERADYLDHACGGDAELRRRVERLLEAHPQAADFMARPAVERPGGDALDREPHPPGSRPDPDRTIADDGPTPQPGRREDIPGQGSRPGPAPTTSSDVTMTSLETPNAQSLQRLRQPNEETTAALRLRPKSSSVRRSIPWRPSPRRRNRSPIPESPATSMRNRLVISG